MSLSKSTACGFLFMLSLNASYLGVFMALLSILYTFSLCSVESFKMNISYRRHAGIARCYFYRVSRLLCILFS